LRGKALQLASIELDVRLAKPADVEEAERSRPTGCAETATEVRIRDEPLERRRQRLGVRRRHEDPGRPVHDRLCDTADVRGDHR
jgi:hypothetical protein